MRVWGFKLSGGFGFEGLGLGVFWVLGFRIIRFRCRVVGFGRPRNWV